MEDTSQNPVAEATPNPVVVAETATAQAPAPVEEYPAMTMEDVIASEESRVADLNRGEIVSGTVVFVGSEGVSVDVGAKIEGLIPLNQLSEEAYTVEQAQEQFKPGDKLDAYVVRSDIANGIIILSKKRAEQDRGWRKL
ncbi:MAG: S1 RNA-binding domain-containing protein, partial [Deinococcales bacterium]